MRHLGALAFLLFWMLAASGVYLYLRFDTSASGVRLDRRAGVVVRRRAAQRPPLPDAFVVVTVLHLLSEPGSVAGAVSAFSWISGILLVWLLYAWASSATGWCGTRARSSPFSRPWNGWASPRVGEAPDRLFSLFVFLHIGLPLALLAGMWVHVQRLGRPRPCRRALMWGCAAMLFAAAALRPAVSEPQWDPRAAGMSRSTGSTSSSIRSCTPPRPISFGQWRWAPRRCFFDAVCFKETPPRRRAGRSGELQRLRPLSRTALTTPSRSEKAVVLPERCAACGICAGACPSSTPFRSIQHLVSESSFRTRRCRGCDEARRHCRVPRWFLLRESPVAGAIPLRCARHAAALGGRVRAAPRSAQNEAVGCEGDCAYRLGMELCEERFAGRREPHLRATVRPEGSQWYSFVLR